MDSFQAKPEKEHVYLDKFVRKLVHAGDVSGFHTPPRDFVNIIGFKPASIAYLAATIPPGPPPMMATVDLDESIEEENEAMCAFKCSRSRILLGGK